MKVSANFLKQLIQWEKQCRDEQTAQANSSATAEQAGTAKSQPEPAVQTVQAVEPSKRKRAAGTEGAQAEQAVEESEAREAKQTGRTRDADADGGSALDSAAEREQELSSSKRQKLVAALVGPSSRAPADTDAQRLLQTSANTQYEV